MKTSSQARWLRVVGAMAIACAVFARAEAQPPKVSYERAARVEHLRHAIEALRGMGVQGRRALDQALYDGTRATCRPTVRPATVACTSEVGRATCVVRADRERCTSAADVVLVNQHAEADLVDEPTRMRLVATSSDYHGAALGELWKRYALLAAEFALAEPDAERDEGAADARVDLAVRIDRFCSGRDRVPHPCEPGVATCLGSLAWQRCAAALAWYVTGGGVRP